MGKGMLQYHHNSLLHRQDGFLLSRCTRWG